VGVGGESGKKRHLGSPRTLTRLSERPHLVGPTLRDVYYNGNRRVCYGGAGLGVFTSLVLGGVCFARADKPGGVVAWGNRSQNTRLPLYSAPRNSSAGSKRHPWVAMARGG